MIADKEVHDLDLAGKVAGSFDRAGRKLELTRGDFVTRDVPFSITGVVIQRLAAVGRSSRDPGRRHHRRWPDAADAAARMASRT